MRLDIELSEIQREQFKLYYKMLIEWNNKMNLTSITDEREVYSKHFIDSLWLSKVVKLQNQSLLDVGSGAGFPSIPLKIVFPNLDITIIDTLKKRITFLENLTEKLGISVNLIHGRIEDHKIKSNYDIVTARAVAPLDILVELCMPFVNIEGLFLPMKGSSVMEEVTLASYAIKMLGGKLDSIFNYEYDGYQRSIPIIKKLNNVSNQYPRSYAKIKKNPLR